MYRPCHKGREGGKELGLHLMKLSREKKKEGIIKGYNEPVGRSDWGEGRGIRLQISLSAKSKGTR